MSQEKKEIKEENIDNILNKLTTEQIISYISNDIVTILILLMKMIRYIQIKYLK